MLQYLFSPVKLQFFIQPHTHIAEILYFFMQYELIIAEIAVCQILLDKRIKFLPSLLGRSLPLMEKLPSDWGNAPFGVGQRSL